MDVLIEQLIDFLTNQVTQYSRVQGIQLPGIRGAMLIDVALVPGVAGLGPERRRVVLLDLIHVQGHTLD